MDNKSARSSGTCGSTALHKCTWRRGPKQHEAIECDLTEFGQVEFGGNGLARGAGHFDLDDARFDRLGFEFQGNNSAAQSRPAAWGRRGAFDGISRDGAWFERFFFPGEFELKGLPEVFRV